MMWLPDCKKIIEDMCIRVDTMHERAVDTDGQTDRHRTMAHAYIIARQKYFLSTNISP